MPVHILLPIIVMMTFVGTYSYNNSLNDVYLMVASGFLGYFMNKLGFSMSAIIIGIILGGMAEQNFVGSLIMSDGSFAIFFQRPLCLFFPGGSTFIRCFHRFWPSCSKEAKFYLTNSLRLAKLSI